MSKEKKKTIGYAYKTKTGSLCIKGEEMMDFSQIGRQIKKGTVYVETRGKDPFQKDYVSAADEYEKSATGKVA